VNIKMQVYSVTYCSPYLIKHNNDKKHCLFAYIACMRLNVVNMKNGVKFVAKIWNKIRIEGAKIIHANELAGTVSILLLSEYFIVSCGVRDKIKECTSLFLPWMS
jgi:hypothetical protein